MIKTCCQCILLRYFQAPDGLPVGEDPGGADAAPDGVGQQAAHRHHHRPGVLGRQVSLFEDFLYQSADQGSNELSNEQDDGDDGGGVGHAVGGALDPGVVAGGHDALVHPQPDLEDPVDEEGGDVDHNTRDGGVGQPGGGVELVGLSAQPDVSYSLAIVPLAELQKVIDQFENSNMVAYFF